jgi:hypothetical protein
MDTVKANFNNQREWRELIWKRLDSIEKNQILIREQIATLKIKAGIWGLLGGFGPAALIVILWLLKSL